MQGMHRRNWAVLFIVFWLVSCASQNAVPTLYSVAQGGVLCAAGGKRAFYLVDAEHSCIMVYRSAGAVGDPIQLLSARNIALDLKLDEYPVEGTINVKKLKQELGFGADQVKMTGAGVSAIVYTDPASNAERLAVFHGAARRFLIYELTDGDKLRLVACRNIQYDAEVMEIRNERPSILDIKQKVDAEQGRGEPRK